MKTILKLALLILIPTITQAQSGWNLVFSDEFNGSSLNNSVWSTTYPGGGQCTQQNEAEVYLPGALSEGSGNLTITATNNGSSSNDGGGFICPGPWESGLIQTNTSGTTFTYGYFDAREKLPSGAGFWTAFWLYAASGFNGPEIDVMETLNTATTTIYQTYHATPPQQDQNVATSGIDCHTSYCDFAVDWEPGSLKFYLNGTLTYTYTNADVSNVAMYVLSNFAVGASGSFPGSWDNTSPSPANMLIDYIRVYQHPVSGTGCYSVIPGPTPIPSTSCSSPSSTIHYVDYTTGSDSNAGTTTGSPWKHAPGMMGLTPSGSSTGDGCTANCASYTPVAGDKIILKGGTVWPYTTAPWTFTQSGSASTTLYGCRGTGCIYIGNAVGAGLAAWNSGTVTSITLTRDLGGWSPSSPPSISCSGGGGSGAAATPLVVPAANNDPNIAGFIYHINLTSGGSSYTSAPNCSLSGGTGIATLASTIDGPIFDLGNGSSIDWPAGQCGSFPNTCEPGINIGGNYVILNGLEVRNLRVQAILSGSSSPVNLLQGHSTASNMYVHGMWVDCYFSGSCIQYDVSAGAIYLGNVYDEAANNTIEDGDAGFLGNSTQQSNGICTNNSFCTAFEFGVTSAVQAGLGPVSAHGNLEWMNAWQIRFVGNDASGNDPFLMYGNEIWLADYLINPTAHINSRYMQLSGGATLISYNNIIHSEVGGTSSQIQCGTGQTFTYFNEVQWNIGTGTQPYSADMADAGGTGGCTLNLYNDTMYASNGGPCVNSQAGTNVTNIVMQNLHCIQTPGAQNPFWSNGIANSAYQTSGGSQVLTNVQAASAVQSISTANGQGYANNTLFAPIGSSGATVQFQTSPGSANLTSLCMGYLTLLCNDINGNSRPATGGWQAGAYMFTGGLPTASNPSCSPGSGSYSSAQSVTCSTSSGGAIICYSTSTSPSTNGSSGCSVGTLYSGAIGVSLPTVLRVIAGGSGYLDSSVVTYTYTLTGVASTPVCSPAGGSFSSTQSVTCTTASGPVICYGLGGVVPATNGTTGCTTGTLYSGAISISSSTVLKAIAGGTGFSDGGVATYTFTILSAASNPSCSPGTGSYTGTQSVGCTFSSAGSIGCYTLNGTAPQTNGSSGCNTGTKYSGNISIASSSTLKVISGGSGYADSSVVSYVYTITGSPSALTPVCVPGTGSYATTQSVTCSIPISKVQDKSASGTTSPLANSLTAVGTGHLITGLLRDGNTTCPPDTLPTASDNGSPVSTYTSALSFNDTNGACMSLVYSPNVTGAPTSISGAFSTGGAQLNNIMAEFSGISPSSPVDVTIAGLQNTSAQTATSRSFTPTTTPELATVCLETIGVQVSGLSVAAGTGSDTWVLYANPATRSYCAYALLNSAGARSVTFTWTSAAAPSGTLGTVFKNSGAILCYTTNGTTPATNGTTGCTTGTKYTTAISISATSTLKVIAGGTGFLDGPVSTYAYTISSPVASTPVCTPPAGTYASTQSVTCSAATGPVICYTVNGATPQTNGTTGCTTGSLYSGAITVSSTETVKAVAGGTSYSDGSVASYAYVIATVGPSAPWPLFSITTKGNHTTCPACPVKTSYLCSASDGKWICNDRSGYSLL